MNEVRYYNRIARKYEKVLNADSKRIAEQVDYYISQLTLAIDETDKIVEISGKEIQEWADCIQDAFECETKHVFLKSFYYTMKRRRAENNYYKALVKIKGISDVQIKYKAMLDRFKQIKAFCAKEVEWY